MAWGGVGQKEASVPILPDPGGPPGFVVPVPNTNDLVSELANGVEGFLFVTPDSTTDVGAETVWVTVEDDGDEGATK